MKILKYLIVFFMDTNIRFIIGFHSRGRDEAKINDIFFSSPVAIPYRMKTKTFSIDKTKYYFFQ